MTKNKLTDFAKWWLVNLMIGLIILKEQLFLRVDTRLSTNYTLFPCYLPLERKCLLWIFVFAWNLRSEIERHETIFIGTSYLIENGFTPGVLSLERTASLNAVSCYALNPFLNDTSWPWDFLGTLRSHPRQHLLETNTNNRRAGSLVEAMSFQKFLLIYWINLTANYARYSWGMRGSIWFAHHLRISRHLVERLSL